MWKTKWWSNLCDNNEYGNNIWIFMYPEYSKLDICIYCVSTFLYSQLCLSLYKQASSLFIYTFVVIHWTHLGQVITYLSMRAKTNSLTRWCRLQWVSLKYLIGSGTTFQSTYNVCISTSKPTILKKIIRRLFFFLHWGMKHMRYSQIYSVILRQETLACWSTDWLTTKSSIVAQWYKFGCCHQRDSKSLADFIGNLRRLAACCNFKADALDENLRDRFICSLTQEYICSRLLMETDDLSSDWAVEIITSLEGAKFNVHHKLYHMQLARFIVSVIVQVNLKIILMFRDAGVEALT